MGVSLPEIFLGVFLVTAVWVLTSALSPQHNTEQSASWGTRYQGSSHQEESHRFWYPVIQGHWPGDSSVNPTPHGQELSLLSSLTFQLFVRSPERPNSPLPPHLFPETNQRLFSLPATRVLPVTCSLALSSPRPHRPLKSTCCPS